MPSWIIGKMIFRTWKNRWWSLTKQSPLLGLLPLLFLAGILSVSLSLYQTTYTTLQSMFGPLNLPMISKMIENYVGTSFLFFSIGLVLLWQWSVRSRLQHHLLQTLPIRKRDWTYGQLIPIFLLLLILILSIFLPILLAFVKPFSFSIFQNICIIFLYLFLLTAALNLGLAWHQAIHLLTSSLLRNWSNSVHRAFHGAFLLFSLLFATACFPMLTRMEIWALLAPWLPHSLFAKFVQAMGNDMQTVLLSLAAIIGYWFVTLLLLRFVFRLEKEWQPEENIQWLPLRSWQFRKPAWLSVSIFEFKRFARDYETHMYSAVFLCFLLFLSWIGNQFTGKVLQVFQIVFGQLVYFGLPFFLSIYPLRSRGKDLEMKHHLRSLPLSYFTYTTGKMGFYAGIFPLVVLGMLQLLLWIAQGSFVPIVPALKGVGYSLLIFSLAYTVGTLFPSHSKSFLNVLLLNLIFVVISLPIFFLLNQFLFAQPLPLFLMESASIGFLLYLLSVSVEKWRAER